MDQRRLADVAWTHGTLVPPPTPPEPRGLDDGSAAALLDEAEQVGNNREYVTYTGRHGGAAISIRSVTGVPIKFLGTGEKVDESP